MDVQLIKQVMEGDPLAQRALIERYHLTLKKFVISYSSFKYYEDVLQETWIKIFNNVHKFQFKSDIQTWMIRIAINTANTQHKREQSSDQSQYNDIDNLLFHTSGAWKSPIASWQVNSPEANYSCERLQSFLDSEIFLLPVNQKAVLTLHDIQGLSLKQICNILEISKSNVRVLLHRARQQLLLKVDSYYKEKKC